MVGWLAVSSTEPGAAATCRRCHLVLPAGEHCGMSERRRCRCPHRRRLMHRLVLDLRTGCWRTECHIGQLWPQATTVDRRVTCPACQRRAPWRDRS